jgi:hypothetical protein
MTIYAFLKRFCKTSLKMGFLSAPCHMKSTLSVLNTTSDLSYGQEPSGPPGKREDLQWLLYLHHFKK